MKQMLFSWLVCCLFATLGARPKKAMPKICELRFSEEILWEKILAFSQSIEQAEVKPIEKRKVLYLKFPVGTKQNEVSLRKIYEEAGFTPTIVRCMLL